MDGLGKINYFGALTPSFIARGKMLDHIQRSIK